MSPLKLSLFTVVSALSLSLSGCAVRARPVVYEVEGGGYARGYSQGGYAQGYQGAYAPGYQGGYADGSDVEPAGDDEVVVVNQPPPPVRVEDPGPCPGVGYVWVGGRWGYTMHGWAWNHGRWAHGHGRPWVAGRWERRHHGFVWSRGHWG